MKWNGSRTPHSRPARGSTAVTTRYSGWQPATSRSKPPGDRLVFGLCPSKPAVQRYLTALVANLDRRTQFDRIDLEQFDYFCGTGFGWHHQKIHVALGDLGEFLFGLCFCEACRANAADASI